MTEAHTVIRAVLFDLDGTLLDISMDEFLPAYLTAIGPVLAAVTGIDARTAVGAVLDATDAVCADQSALANRHVFDARFEQLTGVNISRGVAAETIDAFYRDEFPRLQGPHAPRPGGRSAVECARGLGLATVVATNPIFPRAAIEERMRWAGVGDVPFDLLTTYEWSRACKPSPTYFRQIAEHLGVACHECLMVGDDAGLDMPAADVGMQTFYVGPGSATSTYAGDISDVADLLERVARD